jgi:hypothetical protein
MRGRFIVERAWLWAGLGIALGLGIVPDIGTPGEARATEGPEPGCQAGETVTTARALVAQLEAQLRSTESSHKKARELLAKLEDEGPPRQPAPGEVANPRKPTGDDLVGIWRLVGERRGDEYHKPSYDMYRIMTPGHFVNFPFDPKTGKVMDWVWGSYSLKDGTYTGHYDDSTSEAIRTIIGKEHKFTDRIEGDRWYHVGKTATGQTFDDLYERVNKPRSAKSEGEGPPRQPASGEVTNPRDASGDDLVGIWRMVGEKKGGGDEYQKPAVEMYKIMTPNRYFIISFHPETGKVIHWAEGSYSLKDGTFTGHYDHSNGEAIRAIIGKEYKFTSKVAGDRWYYHSGTLPNGVRRDSLWERINTPR